MQNQVFWLHSLHTNWAFFYTTSNTWVWLSVAHIFCSALSCPVCRAAFPTRATHPALLTVGIFTSHLCRHPKCHQCEGQVRHHCQRNNNFSVFQACLSFKLQPKWLWHDPVESHGSSDICFCFRKDWTHLYQPRKTPQQVVQISKLAALDFGIRGKISGTESSKSSRYHWCHAGLKIIKWTGNLICSFQDLIMASHYIQRTESMNDLTGEWWAVAANEPQGRN